MTDRLGRIAVIGTGIAAWMSAAFLSRALKRLGTEVVVVPFGHEEPPPVLASLPSLETFHHALGFDLRDLMRATGASFRLGTLHAQTGGVHAYGDTGAPFGNVPFHLAWRAHAEDLSPAAYGTFSLAVLAARKGRFAPPIEDGPPGSGYSTGLHLEGPAYRDYLERAARHYGVVRSASLAMLDIATGAVSLTDGTGFRADLVIDTSGLEAGSGRINFTGLPGRLHVRYGRMQSSSPLGLSTLSALSGCATIDIPLKDDIIRVLMAPSDGSAHLASSTLRKSGHEMVPEAACIVESSCSCRPWQGKVVRIGDAACMLPPVEGAWLRTVQIGLESLIQLLPGAGSAGPEMEEYNRVVTEAYQALADFVSLSFLSPKSMLDGLPRSLALRIENFTSRGRIVLMDGESFTRDSWAAAFIAAGWEMSRADAHASALPRAKVRATLEGIAGTLSASSETLPDQRTFLRRAGLIGAQPTGAG